MRKSLAVLVALLAASAAPVQAAPEGFRESNRLTPRAQALSGNAAAVVYCARTYSAWEMKVREFLGSTTPTHRVHGMTISTRNEMYLPRPTCLALENWLRGKPASAWEVGVAALVLGHESVHLRGIHDEKTAECSALRALPTTLRRHFGVKKLTVLKETVAAAQTANRRSPHPC